MADAEIKFELEGVTKRYDGRAALHHTARGGESRVARSGHAHVGIQRRHRAPLPTLACLDATGV